MTKYLYFDVETTGLPIKKNFNSYPDICDNSKYDSSRIIQIGYGLTLDSVVSYYRKPIDFSTVDNSHIHKITYEDIKTKGILLSKIINNYKLKEYIQECDFIVGHNVLFDLHILGNELHRLNFTNLRDSITKVIATKKYICTGELGTNICKIPLYSNVYKMPKLSELYFFLFNKQDIILHDAKHDVETLIKIHQKILKNYL